MITDLQKAYFAGMIDGDGCISIIKEHSSYTIQVTVLMTRKEVPELLHSLYDGRLSTHSRQENHKDVWCWRVSYQKAENFLLDIQPFLILKSEQCRLALDLRKHILESQMTRGLNRNEAKDTEILQYRESLKQRMNILNKRGRNVGNSTN